VAVFCAAYNLGVPVLDPHTVDVLSLSPSQTQRLGARIGELLRAGDLVCLRGDLGAGKTTFAQGIARGWGVGRPVTSPTFILVNEYRRADGPVMYHLDAFRLAPGEFPGIDIQEALETGTVIVEWPERLGDALPSDALNVDLRWVDDTRRNLRVWGRGGRAVALADDFRKLAFG
jgi:tRNA threonylcarbamoyladenosine biosynthesis protein TsaE